MLGMKGFGAFGAQASSVWSGKSSRVSHLTLRKIHMAGLTPACWQAWQPVVPSADSPLQRILRFLQRPHLSDNNNQHKGSVNFQSKRNKQQLEHDALRCFGSEDAAFFVSVRVCGFDMGKVWWAVLKRSQSDMCGARLVVFVLSELRLIRNRQRP